MKKLINELQLNKIYEVRHNLHRFAELSGQENKTREYLIKLLRSETSLEIHDMGSWFYAYYASANAHAENIAFRADMDALPMPDTDSLEYRSICENVSHRCGHDGHSAILLALAFLISSHGSINNIYFIFQHGEETGTGARKCATLIREKEIREIYGIHNWSGFDENSVVLKEGTAMCASQGLRIIFKGKASHASQPENGCSPVFTLSEIALEIKKMSERSDYTDCIMSTIVGINSGGRDFGMSPGEGEIDVTLRAMQERHIECFKTEIIAFAEGLAESAGLQIHTASEDIFPETCNDAKAIAKVRQAARSLDLSIINLERPITSSEDFGWYQKECSGAMIFIGNGTDYPQIHTCEYDFNDRIIETAIELLFKIAEGNDI